MAKQEREARGDRMVGEGGRRATSWSAAPGRERSDELQQLYDTAPVGLGFVDLDMRYLRLNERLAAMNGVTVAEHLGRTLREIIPDLAPSVELVYRRVIETGQPVLDVEIHGDTHAAADRDYLVSYHPVWRKDGSLQGVSIVVQDITERKRAEAALREREEEERQFSEQLTALHEVTAELSTALSIDDLCRAAVELGHSRLGFDRLGIWFVGDDEGSATGTYGIGEDGRLRDERGSRVSISPASLAGQVLGSKRPFALRQDAPTMDNRAEVVGRGSHCIASLWNGTRVIGFISTDNLLHREPITERQCKLLTLYASAVGHLCQLKRLEEELRHRAEALSEADHRKDEFLALLAHELRNPLAPMLHALELLKLRGQSEPTLQRPRDVIDRQVRQMARLVDDLLDVSRITHGRIELRKERVDLTVVARSAVETCRPLIEGREHHLSVTLPPEPVWLEADPARLEQIFANLLNNSAKYSEPGGQIWLTVDVEVGENRQAVIVVRDAGVGLAPDLLPRIFDPFTQADRSLDRSQGGLGIGLTLVRRLTELHGGRVHAQSAGPGQGSEFVIRLPILDFGSRILDHPDKVKLPEEAAVSAGPDPKSDFQNPKSTRVLVVDDNVDAAAILAELLEVWGHEVRVVHDGRLVLEEVARFHPSVVLLDIGLPQMDGRAVARRLSKEPQRQSLRLVALTGYGQEEDRRQAQAAGFDDHLVKPVDPAVLRQLLARMPERC